MSRKNKINIIGILLIVFCIFITFLIIRKNKIDKINYSDSIAITEVDKKHMAQINLFHRLEQQINSMEGISSSKISINDKEDGLNVELILITHIDLTADMESNIKNLIKKSSSYNEDEIFLSWSQQEE